MSQIMPDTTPAITHPAWCALTEQCITRPDNPEHHGRGSRWETSGDDVEIVVHQVRLDEEFPPKQRPDASRSGGCVPVAEKHGDTGPVCRRASG